MEKRNITKSSTYYVSSDGSEIYSAKELIDDIRSTFNIDSIKLTAEDVALLVAMEDSTVEESYQTTAVTQA